jgi:hypothetical protein
MPTGYVLTDARNALWDAIDNWPSFADVFKRSYKFDGDDSPEINPVLAQCPAIAVYPDPGTSKEVLNKIYEHSYHLLILLFTPTWSLTLPDQLWQELIKAAWKSDGGSGVPYVKAATGFYPENNFTVEQDRIFLKDGKATLTTLRLTLKVRFNPQ